MDARLEFTVRAAAVRQLPGVTNNHVCLAADEYLAGKEATRG